jgi:hypothetical protein
MEHDEKMRSLDDEESRLRREKLSLEELER